MQQVVGWQCEISLKLKYGNRITKSLTWTYSHGSAVADTSNKRTIFLVVMPMQLNQHELRKSIRHARKPLNYMSRILSVATSLAAYREINIGNLQPESLDNLEEW